MSDDDKYIWPSELSLWQQVHLALGEYLVAFSHLEGSITLYTSITLELPYATVAFMTRDMPFSMKSKLFRRAGAERLTKASAEKLNEAINKADAAVQFRNTLAHGSFIHDGEKGITVVRDGNSSAEIWEGREAINYDILSAKTTDLHQISGLISSWAMDSLERRSLESSPSGPGSGSK